MSEVTLYASTMIAIEKFRILKCLPFLRHESSSTVTSLQTLIF